MVGTGASIMLVLFDRCYPTSSTEGVEVLADDICNNGCKDEFGAPKSKVEDVVVSSMDCIH